MFVKEESIMKKGKIILLGVFTLICTFALQLNAYALQCQGLGKVEIDDKIPNTVSLIVKIIFIVVPVLLVVLGSMDLLKGVWAQKEDEIKKGQQTFIKRLIAGVLIFFVYAIVRLLISAVYDVRSGVFRNGGHKADVKKSVLNRFEREKQRRTYRRQH